jgi:hypothetical protein
MIESAGESRAARQVTFGWINITRRLLAALYSRHGPDHIEGLASAAAATSALQRSVSSLAGKASSIRPV